MSKFPNLLVIGTALAATIATPVLAEKLGLGRPALPEEIAAWNLDVSPDGTGLPAGSGSVEDGEVIFSENCASCHGEFAEGVDNWPKLAGGQGTLARKDPVKTVGSYWPYLSTTWDYVHRSMPFGSAQTLDPDQVYAITAYILYSNDLVDSDFVLSNENFLDVEMPNADGFIVDDRETAEAGFWAEPCMENCKDEVKITMHASVLDVTPATEENAAADTATAAEQTAAAEPAAPAEPAAEAAPAAVAPDPELIAAGEKVFRKCKACHQVGEGAQNKVGPELNGVLGRTAGSLPDFKYSNPMNAAGEGGLIWTDATLAEFLTKPRDYIKGTKMTFAGLKKDDDIKAITAYLASFGN
ncbi:MAG: c-type cytochrome [Paracoccaceae bacterium]